MCPTFILLHCSVIYFYFPTAAHVPIYTQDFSAHVEKLFANDMYGFSEEYKVTANNMFNTYATFYPYFNALVSIQNLKLMIFLYIGNTKNITQT